MLRPEPKPKVKRAVEVPSDLRLGLATAVEMIDSAVHDPDVRVDFDDAIQAPRLCGGKTGKKSRPYHFTYFPVESDRGARWDLQLAELEIRDIAEGFRTSLSLYCCADAACQFRASSTDALCSACDYVPDEQFAHLSLRSAGERLRGLGLPDLPPDSTMAVLIGALGEPDERGGGADHAALGRIPAWVKYRRPEAQVRFEFDDQGRIAWLT
jgi:hypothetical protein